MWARVACKRRQADRAGPLEELAEIGAVGLQRAAAVAGEERHRRELRFIEQRKLGTQHHRRRRGRIEHRHGEPP